MDDFTEVLMYHRISHLEDELGFEDGRIQDWIEGKSQPTCEELEKLSEKFKVGILYWLNLLDAKD